MLLVAGRFKLLLGILEDNNRFSVFNIFPHPDSLSLEIDPAFCSLLKSMAIFIRTSLLNHFVSRNISNLPDSNFIDNFHGYQLNDLVTFLNKFVVYYNQIQQLNSNCFLEITSQLGRLVRETRSVVESESFNFTNLTDPLINFYVDKLETEEVFDDSEFNLDKIIRESKED